MAVNTVDADDRTTITPSREQWLHPVLILDPNDTFPYAFTYARSPAEQFDDLVHMENLACLDKDEPFVEGSDNLCYTVISHPNAWDIADGISDHYNEHVRIRSRLLHASTPLERWQEYCMQTPAKRQEYLEAITKVPHVYVRNKIRWLEREVIAGPETCQFRASVAKCVYQFCANHLKKEKLNVLDPSGGWGDRLLGAMASGVVRQIDIVEPNILLHEGYDRMKSLAPHVQVLCHCDGFEHMSFGQNVYDAILTSPPFFDKEKYYAPYSHNQAEALWGPRHRRSWEKHWINTWYVPFLQKLSSVLQRPGLLCLYVADTTSGSMVSVTHQTCNALGLVLITKINIGRKRQLPIYIFQRNP